MTNLTEIRNQIHTALNQQASAEEALKEAQQAYEAKFAEFEAANRDLVSARNKAIVNNTNAKHALNEARSQAKALLSDEFLDDLPEGFKQNQVKDVIYDPQGFHKQALASFPFLLVLDTKAVNKFFTAMADKQKDGSFVLPENIRSLASVEVIRKPSPIISNIIISNTVIDPEPDLAIFEDALEEVTEENSPADEPEEDTSQVPLAQINY